MLHLAFCMNSEMNLFESQDRPPTISPRPEGPETIALDDAGAAAMRQRLHELANVLTGLVIAGGLLCERLEAAELRRYAADIRESGERGSALVRELRRTLLAASGGPEEQAGLGEAAPRRISGDFL
jgi:hypothetical protein